VVPHTDEIQAAEDGLGNALMALVRGTRPFVSTSMVYRFLHDRFHIWADNVDVRRYEPEDFIVRFRLREDRDRVLASRPGGGLLPLLWRP
jgi:hypothetical protein